MTAKKKAPANKKPIPQPGNSKGDLLLNPHDIVADPAKLGRYKPINEAAVISMAISMLKKTQLAPVQVRKVPGSTGYDLTFGFTRHRAAIMLRDGFTAEDGAKYHDPDFKLRATLRTTNDKESHLANIVENVVRNTTSPIDDAHNQRNLKEVHGFSDQEIADLYDYPDTSKVSRLRKLLLLSSKNQDLVHEGQLPMAIALKLADLPETKQEAAIKEAVEMVGGNINTRKLVAKLRNDALEVSEKGDGGKPKTHRRSLADLTKFYQWQIEVSENDDVKKFCEDMLAYISGNKSDTAMRKDFEKAFKNAPK